MKQGVFVFAVLSLAWLQAAAEIYKCSDGEGRVQYSDKPCAGHSSIITPAAAPAADPHAAERRQRADKLLRALDEEHAEQLRAAAEAEAELEQRRRDCARARDWLARVSSASTLYRLAEDGSRVNLDDAEHAATLAKAEAEVARWCD